MKTSCSDSNRAAALELYQTSELTSKEIADKFKISSATLTSWAKDEGLTLRGRGRRRYQEPTARQRAILESAELVGQAKTSRRFKLKKQGVHRIVKRWENWQGFQQPEPGDVLRFRDRLVIVTANDNDGGGFALDKQTGASLRITSWVVKGRRPKKVGEDPRYKANGHSSRVNKRKRAA